MPVDGLEIMSKFDGIMLGAIGAPDIPDHETLWGILIPIRREFDQYINLRPIKSYQGVTGPLRSETPIDILIVRENTEGEYSKIGGRYSTNTPYETALQVAVFSRHGIERVTQYAIDKAMTRKKRITSATKSNGIIYSMPFWDEVVNEKLAKHPDIELRHVLIDALAAAMVLKPEQFDVIVASNLFGDILSDLAAALVGSIGIAGKGIANPIGAIQTASMMLEHFGEFEAAREITDGIAGLLKQGIATGDLGGRENTAGFTNALISILAK
jgi:tartrate dehydrogenase/decarboxylase/D-malate dehydrogenase